MALDSSSATRWMSGSTDAADDGDAGVAGHLDPVERRDAAGGALDDVGQRERLAPLLTRPLAAQGREALRLAGLLGGGVVDAHGGLQDVRVGRVALHHARRLLLDAVRGGLDLAAQGDDGDLDRVAAGDALLLHPGEHAGGLVETGLRTGVTRKVRERRGRLAVEERGQLLLRQGVEGGGSASARSSARRYARTRSSCAARSSREDRAAISAAATASTDGCDTDEPCGPRGAGARSSEQDGATST